MKNTLNQIINKNMPILEEKSNDPISVRDQFMNTYKFSTDSGFIETKANNLLSAEWNVTTLGHNKFRLFTITK